MPDLDMTQDELDIRSIADQSEFLYNGLKKLDNNLRIAKKVMVNYKNLIIYQQLSYNKNTAKLEQCRIQKQKYKDMYR